MWFPKYRTKVMSAIQSEAQRGVKFIELAAIKGGPVTQVSHFSGAFHTRFGAFRTNLGALLAWYKTICHIQKLTVDDLSR